MAMQDQGNIKPYPIFASVPLSASVTSETFDVLNTDNFGMEFSWSGSDAVGAITIETSITGNFWQAIPDAFFTPAGPFPVTGASGVHIIDLNQLGPCKFRVKYTRTSGTTGTLIGTLCGKEL